jgi:hypothetical protein
MGAAITVPVAQACQGVANVAAAAPSASPLVFSIVLSDRAVMVVQEVSRDIRARG